MQTIIEELLCLTMQPELIQKILQYTICFCVFIAPLNISREIVFIISNKTVLCHKTSTWNLLNCRNLTIVSTKYVQRESVCKKEFSFIPFVLES